MNPKMRKTITATEHRTSIHFQGCVQNRQKQNKKEKKLQTNNKAERQNQSTATYVTANTITVYRERLCSFRQVQGVGEKSDERRTRRRQRIGKSSVSGKAFELIECKRKRT